ncbi:MAG: diacylglycerol kinase family protein [Planctomicrobium sp.]|nr:diacylglycerol kinase family protein [Planctomicrobium sp.]
MRGAMEASLNERNLKIQWMVSIVVIVAGGFFQLQMWEWCFLILSIGAVLSAETMNTAIESLVDLLEPEQHESARKAKDFAAGSVLLISIAACVIGLLIFGNHVLLLLKA